MNVPKFSELQASDELLARLVPLLVINGLVLRGEAFLVVGDMVCRRSPLPTDKWSITGCRRIRDRMLVIERVADVGDGGRVGYFCRDYEMNLHFVNAHEIKRVEAMQ